MSKWYSKDRMTAIWTKGLLIGFVISVSALLILQLLPEPVRVLQVLEQTGDIKLDFRRGGTISTGTDARVLLSIDGILVGLSENTDLRLDQILRDEVHLFILRGRVAVDARQAPLGSVSVRTDRVTSISDGVWSLVNYDFAERVNIFPINGTVQLFVNGIEQPTTTLQSVEVSELEPYTINYTTSDLSSSSEADFYHWFDMSLTDVYHPTVP